jgi:hypothetical protein
MTAVDFPQPIARQAFMNIHPGEAVAQKTRFLNGSALPPRAQPVYDFAVEPFPLTTSH